MKKKKQSYKMKRFQPLIASCVDQNRLVHVNKIYYICYVAVPVQKIGVAKVAIKNVELLLGKCMLSS